MSPRTKRRTKVFFGTCTRPFPVHKKKQSLLRRRIKRARLSVCAKQNGILEIGERITTDKERVRVSSFSMPKVHFHLYVHVARRHKTTGDIGERD